MSSGDRLPPQYLDARALARALRHLPVFPLPDMVMFPHALLPLHIFEDRYRKMTRDALAGNRLIGLALQTEDEVEGESPPRFAPILGVGEIVMAQELPDGRFNLVMRGRMRVRLDRELDSDEPYRLIAAREIPDDDGAVSPEELGEAEASLRSLIFGLADALPEGGELLKQVVSAQTSAAELVNVVAAALVADTGSRQRLLETTDVVARIEAVSDEVAVVTARIAPDRPTN
jgi:Lon protease-like protein